MTPQTRDIRSDIRRADDALEQTLGRGHASGMADRSTEDGRLRAMSMLPVLHSFAYSLDYLREQLADVAAADMVAQPSGVVNHPAWVIDHLTLICQNLGGVIGVEPWLPDDWAEHFGSSSVPVADASVYETKDDALALLRDAQSRITHAVEQLDESRSRSRFPMPRFGRCFRRCATF